MMKNNVCAEKKHMYGCFRCPPPRVQEGPCGPAEGSGLGSAAEGQRCLRHSGRQPSKIPGIKPKENKQIKRHCFSFS